jgi:hypothetical protein
LEAQFRHVGEIHLIVDGVKIGFGYKLMKKHGFDLESTMLRHFERLSRLILAVSILYVWLISVGTSTILRGLRT